MLRSVLFLTFAFSAHLTREVLSEQVGVGVLCCTQELSKQVGVGGKLCSVVHMICRSKLCLVCLLLVHN